MENKTKYRIVSDGYCNFLEYLDESENWLGIKRNNWNKIQSIKTAGELIYCGDYSFFVSEAHWDLEQFVKKYPDIQAYFDLLKVKIDELRQKLKEREEIREEKKKKITYLN